MDAQVTPVVNSRNITKAAQKRASEIVDKLGNDDLYEEEERDREMTAEDIIRADRADEPADNQPESSNREPEPVVPDEIEMVSEHVDVDPDLNELYLAKAKITGKLLLGDYMSDDEKNSNEENEDTDEGTTSGINENITNTGGHSNSEMKENTERMNINRKTETNVLMSKKIAHEEETGKVSEILSDSQVIADQQEKLDNGRECRKKQQSESEEGEISDHTDDETNEGNQEKNDINEEITEDWNFLERSRKGNETTEESCSKRTKKKKKKRSRSRKGHRDRSSDKHLKMDEADNRDTKRRHRHDVERSRSAEKENKSKRIKQKFEAPLFVNTIRSTAEASKSEKITAQQFEDQSVKSYEKELTSSGPIPKLNTDMLKKILANVQGQQSQNLVKETSSTNSLHKVAQSDAKKRADGTTSTSKQEPREKNVGPVEFLAQSKGLSIPGAECQSERETPSVQSNISHLSFGASANDNNSQVEFNTTWEKKRPSNSGMKTPPWKRRKKPQLEAQKILPTDEKQQVKAAPKDDEDGPTVLFHGSGSQNTGNRDADNNSMYSLNLKAPWYKSSTTTTPISSCERQETREDSISSAQKSESQTASGSLPPCPKEDVNMPDGMQRVVSKAPWMNKATNNKNQPSQNQYQECRSNILELQPPLNGAKNSNELSLPQLPDTKPLHGNGKDSAPTHTVSHHSKIEQRRNSAEQLTAASGNRSPPSHAFGHHSQRVEHQSTKSNVCEETPKTGLQQMSGHTSSTKSSVNRSPPSNASSHQSEIGNRRNSVEHVPTGSDKSEDKLKAGPQQRTGQPSVTKSAVNRRRSSQMSEAASDTSSVTSSSPRSHVGISPGSSTSGASHRKDPERDQQIFEKRRDEYMDQLDDLLKQLKIKKTDEEMRQFEETKWKYKMILLDIEINELIIHEKREGNRYQVGFLVEIGYIKKSICLKILDNCHHETGR